MSEGFAYLVIMHNFSLTEYVASNEEGYKLHEVELYQKSLDEDNIGCYYCVYFGQDCYWGFCIMSCILQREHLTQNMKFQGITLVILKLSKLFISS